MVGQRRETGTTISRLAAAAITKNLLLSLDSNDAVILCTATLKPLGQAMDTVDDTEVVGIRLGSDGILELTASGVITFRAPVYTDAGGKITATAVQGAYCIGFAGRAAAADGDVIPVIPLMTPFVVQDLAANGYVAPAGGATVDTEGRAALALLATAFADLRAKVIATGLAIT